RPVMAVVRRPPVLRRGHHLLDVLLQGIEVEFLELFGVVELLAHGVGQGTVSMKYAQVQLTRPPVAIGRGLSRRVLVNPVGQKRVFCFGSHISSWSILSGECSVQARISFWRMSLRLRIGENNHSSGGTVGRFAAKV